MDGIKQKIARLLMQEGANAVRIHDGGVEVILPSGGRLRVTFERLD